MRHPFDLNPDELEAIDLEFEESLSDDEASQVGGGLSIAIATTLALGEEGGDCDGSPKPIDPPVLTTEAIGEEGGDCYPKQIPLPELKPIDPPVFTTLALGEEGGCDYSW